MMIQEISISNLRVIAGDVLPQIYDSYCEHARLADEFDLSSTDNSISFVAVGRGNEWPALVVAQRYWPDGFGFHPGILVVPETATVFIGAGERLLAYKLEPQPVRLWTDKPHMGFWSWNQSGAFVLMAAELEFAAWSTTGTKLWTTFVEPPWHYTIREDMIELDVMGTISTFPIATGPPIQSAKP